MKTAREQRLQIYIILASCFNESYDNLLISVYWHIESSCLQMYSVIAEL